MRGRLREEEREREREENKRKPAAEISEGLLGTLGEETNGRGGKNYLFKTIAREREGGGENGSYNEEELNQRTLRDLVW